MTMKELVNPKENMYFGLAVFFSVLIYLALIISMVGIVYILLGVLVAWLAQGLLTAEIKAHAIRIGDRQFPEVYATVKKLSAQLEMKEVPDVYVMQAGGALNAFATRFLSRDFVLIYADIFELAYDKGEEALNFILCHELAHIKRKHIQNRWLIYPSMFMPFLGTAYMRACEYTCDTFGANFVPKGCVDGLMLLGVGTKLYKDADLASVAEQTREGGFFLWLFEAVSTHPNLTKRIKAVAARTGKISL
jgi:Zn-dependent protease with chaperone function